MCVCVCTCARACTYVSVLVKLLGDVSGVSEEPWSFMSQHRKNSARGKVIAKKWFIRIWCLWSLQAGGGEGASLWELSGLQFYNQRKSGEGGKTSFFFILSRHHASIISSSFRSGRGVFLSLYSQARTVAIIAGLRTMNTFPLIIMQRAYPRGH